VTRSVHASTPSTPDPARGRHCSLTHPEAEDDRSAAREDRTPSNAESRTLTARRHPHLFFSRVVVKNRLGRRRRAVRFGFGAEPCDPSRSTRSVIWPPVGGRRCDSSVIRRRGRLASPPRRPQTSWPRTQRAGPSRKPARRPARRADARDRWRLRRRWLRSSPCLPGRAPRRKETGHAAPRELALSVGVAACNECALDTCRARAYHARQRGELCSSGVILHTPD